MQASIRNLKGIGPQKFNRFSQLGIKTIDDLISHFPRRHENRSVLTALSHVDLAEKYTFKIEILKYNKVRIKNGKTLYKFIGSDDTGELEIVYINTPYIDKQLKIGGVYYLYGQVKIEGSAIVMFHPEVKALDKGAFGIVPIYPLTDGINYGDIVKALTQVKGRMLHVVDMLPPSILDKYNFMPRGLALQQLHFPTDEVQLKQAIERFKYEELFNMQMALIYTKRTVQRIEKKRDYMHISSTQIASLFPFTLTDGQREAIGQIYKDMDATVPMNRLLQGDVGSGKTAVSIVAAYRAIESGYQVAMMVPTEILAIQHYETFTRYLKNAKIGLLTAQASSKKTALEEIKTGECQMIIGTHAVIQEQVEFNNLSLVITDEQHRFGVKQRKELAQKSSGGVDVLVMSATPIPRTLSLIIYGDMDISTIKELPHGRLPIKTHFVNNSKYKNMLAFIEEHLAIGEQAYFVAPLIEESDKIDLKPAQILYDEISRRYPDYPCALLHGKMKSQEKDNIMQAFKDGIYRVLVSTTVIEVGVDVAQATIIVITHSERFGLAQLHQLRGRVGRGDKQSYCFLLADKLGKISKERIVMMTQTNDGFEIANKDLQIRGPGELLGIKQHGLPELKLADLSADIALVKCIQKDCQMLYKNNAVPQEYIDWLVAHLTL